MINEPTRALYMAHILREKRPDFAWSDLVKHAWYFVRFRRWLRDHVIKFSYYKKDGSIRQAIGTTNLFFVPISKHPLGYYDYKNKSCNTITYFDLEKQEWRSFDIRNFIGFVELFPETKEKEAKRKPFGYGE